MKYLSTRGGDTDRSFEDVLLAGLAHDGGLYVPETWPQLDARTIASFADKSYAQIALDMLHPYMSEWIEPKQLSAILESTYGGFFHDDVTPIVPMGNGAYLLELFHGPTLAFKDLAMQLIGPLFQRALSGQGKRLTIVGATSGDTGSAAIEAIRGRKDMSIFILHPKDRISEVQRRQMTSIHDDNVFNIAIQGSFDDCQNMVKAMFNDQAFRRQVGLSGVNSINCARILAQTVYYGYAVGRLAKDGRKVRVAVPTGNFGDIYAGYVAKQMGLPIGDLIIATNSNDILFRTLQNGTYSMYEAMATLSPSMDIQIASNFERLLFEVLDRNGEQVKTLMEEFGGTRSCTIPPEAMDRIREDFLAARVNDDQTLAALKGLFDRTGQIVDPHTAIGVAADEAIPDTDDQVRVVLATAHPAKFPEAVIEAIGMRAVEPRRLQAIWTADEKYTTMPAKIANLKTYIADRALKEPQGQSETKPSALRFFS